MLDFLTKLFKRQPDLNKHATTIDASRKLEKNQKVNKQISLQTNHHSLEDKKKRKEQDRIHFLKKIEEVAHDESALIALVVHCDFAEGRLLAAQYVYSKQGLESIKNALRNSDKRVVKLMQSRLDAIQKSEQEHIFARECITNAEQLLKQDQLALNQLIDLDKQVATLGNFPEEFFGQFTQLRQQLEQQLEIQQNLQRRLLNITQVPDWIADENLIEKREELEQKLQLWDAELALVIAHEKSHSVPKHLLQEVHQKLQKQKQILASVFSQSQSQNVAKSSSDENVQALLPSIEGTSVSLSNKPEHHTNTKTKHQLNSTQIETLLSQFETALEQGSMQNSRLHERELRDVKLEDSQLTSSQQDRLHQARYAFSQMQSLAKWSSEISRNELIATAEGLTTLSLDAQELVSTVTALRKQWKQIEQTGGASKELWNKFDQACNSAYAPAAMHFQELDEQRQQNLVKAEHFLNDMQTQVQALLQVDETSLNWKKIHQAIFQFQQDWKKLGLIDRKHLTRVKNQFEQSLNSLRVPLEKRQQEEINSRELLIEQANKIESNQRQAVEQVRSLQERWQIQAQQVPLRRQDEQVLWEKFRASCDAVFEKRKQVAESNDAQRLENVKLKTLLCEKLELINEKNINELHQLRSSIEDEWKEIGFVPREQEAVVERRYQLGVQAVNEQIENLRNKEKQLHSAQLLRKIVLCQEVEKTLTSIENQEKSNHSTSDNLIDVIKEWDQISSTTSKNKLHSALNVRFKTAQAALENNDLDYVIQLQKNISLFDETVLHAEIVAGIESPSALASQRLQKQVAVLQTSMKNGQNKNQLLDLVMQLIAMPVEVDADRHHRMLAVLAFVE